jgi:Nineteen complex-related protein 2
VEEETFIPKRSALSKKATESKNESKTESKGRKFGLQVYLAPSPNLQTVFNCSHAMPMPSTEQISSRPTYTKDYLTQLRDSTPSTPKDISRYISEDDSLPESLDSLSMDPGPSARPAEILDEAVIRALKERRRDRATYGEDYLSLDNAPKSSRRQDSDDEDTYLKYVHEPVRLQKDMEGAEKAQRKSQIREALARESDSEAMSEVSSDEWENQQIAKAAPSLVKSAKRNIHAMPEEMIPVPTIQGALARLRGQVEEMKRRRDEMKGVMEELERQKTEILAREEFVQESLAKAGNEYEMLNEEFKSSGVNRGLDEVGDFGTPTAT